MPNRFTQSLQPQSRAYVGATRDRHDSGSHRTGERAATHVLALAAKDRAFRSLHTLIVGQGRPQLLAGSALALAAAADAWARTDKTPQAD